MMVPDMCSWIDLNARPKFLTLAEIEKREFAFERWKMRNDRIRSVTIDGSIFLSVGIEFESGKQGVGFGHRNEGNLGMMLKWLLDLYVDATETTNVLAQLEKTPIRVLSLEDWGGSQVECTYLGHFMQDKWMKCSDWVMAGLVTKPVGIVE